MNRINSTRFMSQEEFKSKLVELDMEEKQYPVAGIPMLVKENKIYVDAGDTHTVIFGATGSKKTRMFVMPSIGIFARAGESFVVTDPKGEIYQRTIGDVVSHGYKSCCINLRNFKEGETWNPLALPYQNYHDGKKAKAIEFATEMAKMIIGTDATDEVFWINTAVSVFSGFILLLFEKTNSWECHFRGLSTLWNTYLADRKKMLRKIKEEFGSTVIYQKISFLDNPSDKTVGSIEAFISMGLNKLCLNEEFVDFLSQEGLDLNQLAQEKNGIYLVIPDENTTYHFVVSLFLKQLYEVLIDSAQKEETKTLPIRMNFLIDEFANIPKIEHMDSMITAARSRNIRFHIIVQGMKQLQQKYAEGADTIVGNCSNWIYLYSKEYQLLEEISRLCGEVIYDNNIRMPLFSEFDLQHLNKTEGEALVLAGRNYPCLSRLADIEEYPYPIIEPGNREKKGWKKTTGFHWNEKGSKKYFLDGPYGFVKRSILQEREEKRWLVAVGPDGMIIGEGVFKKSLVDSKVAIGAMSYILITEKELDPKCMEWYSAPLTVEREHCLYKQQHKENVYVTLDELGKEKFFKEAERMEEKYYATGEKDGKIELTITAASKEEVKKEIFLGEIRGYWGNLGTTYLFQCAFRKANIELAGSEFENADWCMVSDTYGEGGERIYLVEKVNKKGEHAILKISDSRYILNKATVVPY